MKEHVLQRKTVAVPFARRKVPGEEVSDKKDVRISAPRAIEIVLDNVRVLLNVYVNSAGVRRVVNPIHFILNGTRSSVLRSVGLRIYSANMNVEKTKSVYPDTGGR